MSSGWTSLDGGWKLTVFASWLTETLGLVVLSVAPPPGQPDTSLKQLADLIQTERLATLAYRSL